MNGLTQGIHHFALKAQGDEAFDRALSFYGSVLGMPLVRTWKQGDVRGAMLDAGGGIVEITSNGGDSPGEGCIRHLAFATTDVDACVKAVRAAGFVITMEPVDKEIPASPPYPIRIAFCRGPLGEDVEFFCER